MEPVFDLEILARKIMNEPGLLIYFSNDSCSVCKVLKPKVSELLSDRFPALSSCFVDTDKSPVLSGQHRVFTIPTILLFFEAQEHQRFSRNISIRQLEEAIEKPYSLLFDR